MERALSFDGWMFAVRAYITETMGMKVPESAPWQTWYEDHVSIGKAAQMALAIGGRRAA